MRNKKNYVHGGKRLGIMKITNNNIMPKITFDNGAVAQLLHNKTKPNTKAKSKNSQTIW